MKISELIGKLQEIHEKYKDFIDAEICAIGFDNTGFDVDIVEVEEDAMYGPTIWLGPSR